MINEHDIAAMDDEPTRYRVGWEIHRLLNMIEGELNAHSKSFDCIEGHALRELIIQGRKVRDLIKNKPDPA